MRESGNANEHFVACYTAVLAGYVGMSQHTDEHVGTRLKLADKPSLKPFLRGWDKVHETH